MRSIKVFYSGISGKSQKALESDLLFLIISKVTARPLKVVTERDQADLVLVYPYITSSRFFKYKWVIARALQLFVKFISPDALFRWLVGCTDKPIIFVSHENLDRPYWWNMLGRFLIQSSIPRLTFWPKVIDPKGVRFPYWYNYVNWKDYPRVEGYNRFGEFYDIERLMSPLPDSCGRIDKAIMITSHLDFPRASLLSGIQRRFKIDVFGRLGENFSGPKLPLMKKYKFAVVPENSVGFGYDTEKMPEAWIAGCIPLGSYQNPYSDFNPKLFYLNEEVVCSAIREPLLLSEPSLSEIEQYLTEFFE